MRGTRAEHVLTARSQPPDKTQPHSRVRITAQKVGEREKLSQSDWAMALVWVMLPLEKLASAQKIQKRTARILPNVPEIPLEI